MTHFARRDVDDCGKHHDTRLCLDWIEADRHRELVAGIVQSVKFKLSFETRSNATAAIVPSLVGAEQAHRRVRARIGPIEQADRMPPRHGRFQTAGKASLG